MANLKIINLLLLYYNTIILRFLTLVLNFFCQFCIYFPWIRKSDVIIRIIVVIVIICNFVVTRWQWLVKANCFEVIVFVLTQVTLLLLFGHRKMFTNLRASVFKNGKKKRSDAFFSYSPFTRAYVDAYAHRYANWNVKKLRFWQILAMDCECG